MGDNVGNSKRSNKDLSVIRGAYQCGSSERTALVGPLLSEKTVQDKTHKPL